MKNTIIPTLLTLIAFIIVGCGSQESLDITGEWKINPEKSVVEMSKIKEMTADQMESQKTNLTNRIPRFTTVVTEEAISLSKMELPYTTLSSTPSEVVVEADANGKKITITFQTFDAESFKMLSSATNDMDHLIWNKTALPE